MKKNKNKEISVLDFKPLTDKKEKQEIIQWLNNNCSLFSGISLPSDIKLNISEEAKERRSIYGFPVLKPLGKSKNGFCPAGKNSFIKDFWNREIDLYIIKEGNAFSRIDFSVKEGKLSSIRPKSVKDLKKIGIVSEIFCEGEPIIQGIDIWPIISFYIYNDTLERSEFRTNGDLITGSPFGEHIYPTQIISISCKEIKKAFSKSDLFWARLFQIIVERLFINKWRLWFQLSNKAETKLLSILYLYFTGRLPLEQWESEGIPVDNKDRCFKKPKPNTLIDEFEVSNKELVLFSGLTRKCVRELLVGGEDKKDKQGKKYKKGKKSIFEQNERLAQILKCSTVSDKEGKTVLNRFGYYRFSTPCISRLLNRIEYQVLMSTTQKFL